MIGSSGVHGLGGYPTIDLGTNWGAYNMFRIEMLTNGAAPDTGDPIAPIAGDVWGVADPSGRRGILRLKGMPVYVNAYLTANTGGSLHQVLKGDAVYVSTSDAKCVSKGANGAILGYAMETVTNPSTGLTLITPVKIMFI